MVSTSEFSSNFHTLDAFSQLNLTGSNSFNQENALRQNDVEIRHILRSLTQILSTMLRN